jgi:hypothetical protein
MSKPLETNADVLKSRSRGASREMTPDAINQRLDIVDELRELARELRESKRNGPLGTPLATPPTSDNQRQTSCELPISVIKNTTDEV